jgi:hypothetical protein
VPISGFAVGTTFIKRSFNTAIDTGNGGGFEFPRWALDRYFAQVPHATWNATHNTYVFPCDNLPPVLPDVVFGVGNSAKITIPGRVIQYLYISKEANICCTKIRAGGDETVGWGRYILEDLYVVFDYGNKRVGIADKASF